jgi:hypothetical protein
VQIETLERRQSGGQRGTGGWRCVLHGWWRLYFVRDGRLEDFQGEFNGAPANCAELRYEMRGVL